MAGEKGTQQGGQSGVTAAGGTTDEGTKTLNAQRDLVKAQTGLVGAQKELVDAMFLSFGDKFGKSGDVKIETGEGDKFHATAKTAEALRTAAKQVCEAVSKASGKERVALLTDDDRRSLAAYRVAHGDTKLLKMRMDEAVASAGQPLTEAVSPGLAIYGAGKLLSEIAEFTKLFRTDRSLFFSTPELPEQVFVELVAACATEGWRVVFPAAGLDVSFTQNSSEFLMLVDSLGELKNKIAPNDKNKDLIDHYDQFLAKMLAVDDAKFPVLFNILRGEAAAKAVRDCENRILTVRINKMGGTTMKTSSIWRGDRFFASGGVIVSYRYTVGDRVVAADIITIDSGFGELELKTP